MWFLLTAYRTTWKERNDQAKKKLKDLENFQPIHRVKNEEEYLKENTKRSFDKELIMDQSSLQNLGAVVQNTGRMATWAIQRSSGMGLP